MNIPQANFLTTAEFHRGPDLLRPGTLTGQNVDALRSFTQPSLIRDVKAIFVFPKSTPISSSGLPLMGHEKVTDRESVLRALFGPDFRDATATATYQQETETEKRIIYDPIELRRLAVAKNLFGKAWEYPWRVVFDALE